MEEVRFKMGKYEDLVKLFEKKDENNELNQDKNINN